MVSFCFLTGVAIGVVAGMYVVIKIIDGLSKAADDVRQIH